jgi:hypothetical protein
MFSEMPPIKRYVRGNRHMDIKSRVTQDRRVISRVLARLNCGLTCEGVSHEGVIVDLSLKGAFLSSRWLPPQGSNVASTLQTPLLKKILILEGKVLRGHWIMSDHGKMSRFGIRFSHTPLDLIELINKLLSSQRNS